MEQVFWQRFCAKKEPPSWKTGRLGQTEHCQRQTHVLNADVTSVELTVALLRPLHKGNKYLTLITGKTPGGGHLAQISLRC
jgi:hypothetical protein